MKTEQLKRCLHVDYRLKTEDKDFWALVLRKGEREDGKGIVLTMSRSEEAIHAKRNEVIKFIEGLGQ